MILYTLECLNYNACVSLWMKLYMLHCIINTVYVTFSKLYCIYYCLCLIYIVFATFVNDTVSSSFSFWYAMFIWYFHSIILYMWLFLCFHNSVYILWMIYHVYMLLVSLNYILCTAMFSESFVMYICCYFLWMLYHLWILLLSLNAI